MKDPNTMALYCPEKSKDKPCCARLVYSLCPNVYLTNHLRLVLQADDPARYFSLDAVVLSGSSEKIGSFVWDLKGRVFIQPTLFTYGNNSFTFQSSDCSYYSALQFLPGPNSRRSTVSVDVKHRNHPPSVINSYGALFLKLKTQIHRKDLMLVF